MRVVGKRVVPGLISVALPPVRGERRAATVSAPTVIPCPVRPRIARPRAALPTIARTRTARPTIARTRIVRPTIVRPATIQPIAPVLIRPCVVRSALGGRDQGKRADQQADEDLRPQQVHATGRAGGLHGFRHGADPRPGGGCLRALLESPQQGAL